MEKTTQKDTLPNNDILELSDILLKTKDHLVNTSGILLHEGRQYLEEIKQSLEKTHINKHYSSVTNEYLDLLTNVVSYHDALQLFIHPAKEYLKLISLLDSSNIVSSNDSQQPEIKIFDMQTINELLNENEQLIAAIDLLLPVLEIEG